MTSRRDAIRAAFLRPALSDDNQQATAALPRVSAGAIQSLKGTLTGIERENEELRARLAAGTGVVELDPWIIDPSPYADRFAVQNDAAFEALKESIRSRGQEIPVLVRQSPSQPERYQCAYGHRRVRAARDLGIKVRAGVRSLSDSDLVVAQGLENSAREDLSFIERAVFARRMEEGGFDRATVQAALSVDKAEASKLVAVARGLPDGLIEAIGRAPKVGRPRWLFLVDAVKKPEAAALALSGAKAAAGASDERFAAALSAAIRRANPSVAAPKRTVTARSGREIAHVAHRGRRLTMMMAEGADDGFAAFLVDQLPTLFEAYAAGNAEETSRAATPARKQRGDRS